MLIVRGFQDVSFIKGGNVVIMRATRKPFVLKIAFLEVGIVWLLEDAYTGVVDEDVESSIILPHLLLGSLDTGRAGHVSFDDIGLSLQAHFPQLFDGCCLALLIVSCKQIVIAWRASGQNLEYREANASSASHGEFGLRRHLVPLLDFVVGPDGHRTSAR